mgnify:CR=1 FL=1
MSIKVASREHFGEINLVFQNILDSISMYEIFMNNEIVNKSIMISELLSECEEYSYE